MDGRRLVETRPFHLRESNRGSALSAALKAANRKGSERWELIRSSAPLYNLEKRFTDRSSNKIVVLLEGLGILGNLAEI